MHYERVMKLKTLAAQHDKFAAEQLRKAARAAARIEKHRQWDITQEAFRKRREQKARKSDLFQQRRLEDDPEYHSMMHCPD